jgi:hypothetical protein
MSDDAAAQAGAKESFLGYCQGRALATLRAVFNTLSPAVAHVPDHDGVRGALALVGRSLDVLDGDRRDAKGLADLNRAFEALNIWINHEAPDVRPLGPGETLRSHERERNLVNSGIAALKVLELR